MTVVARFPFPPLRSAPERPAGRTSVWLPLTAGFLAGAVFALGVAQANRAALERAAPTLPDIVPPTVSPHPYMPQVRIGMGPAYPISGASAPPRGSAAFWRDGEAPATAAFSFMMDTGQRV